MKKRTEKAVLLKSFKSVRADGHAVKTVYALTKQGIVSIERRIVSTELNMGFTEIRKFGDFIYQFESITFKLESFICIAKDIADNIYKLDVDKIMRSSDVVCDPNDKTLVRIEL